MVFLAWRLPLLRRRIARMVTILMKQTLQSITVQTVLGNGYAESVLVLEVGTGTQLILKSKLD